VPEGQFMVAQGGTNGVNTSFFEFLWWHSVYVQLRYAFAVFGTRLKFLKKIKGVKIPLMYDKIIYAQIQKT